VLAFFWGRHAALSQVPAPTKSGTSLEAPQHPGTPVDPSVYGQRVVGYVSYAGQQYPISREELGEYLIARLGSERLDYLINRKIIEMGCARRGITVTDAEIAKQYAEDLKGFNVSEKDFVNVLLKRRGQSLYEWKEDVIRPRLLMRKFVEGTVKVTEDDLRKAFEARFGDKVECRMIVLSQEQARKAPEIFVEVQNNDAKFKEWAKQSCIPAIAAAGGEVPPIHRHFADKRIEDVAFSLKESQISELLKMEDGTSIILKCVRHIPNSFNTANFEQERVKMHGEILEAKIAQAVPEAFAMMRQQASPVNFLRSDSPRVGERTAQQPALPDLTPKGN
jgi:hypothetical protein